MSLTPSTMLPLGTQAPHFSLVDTVSNQEKTLTQLQGEKGTVVMFIANHCPYVLHVLNQLVALANDYQAKKINFIAISSNDIINYPSDAPDKMRTLAQSHHFPFPYLYDESQAVAKAYQAACTPDFFVFDGQLACVYRGRIDGATPGNDIPNDGCDMRAALDNLLADQPINAEQHPSMGCNIKWKE